MDKKSIAVYAPTYKKAGVDYFGNQQWSVTMKEIGQALSYEDAKKKFGKLAIVDGYAKFDDEY